MNIGLTFFFVVDTMKTMNTITVPKNLIKTKSDDLVVISRKEYESMKAKIIPVFFLKGEKAKNLDKRVEEASKEHKKGKTETLESFLEKEYPGLRKQ